VAITDRGRVVAELTPPRTNGRQHAFAELVRRGSITLRKNDARAYRPGRKRLLAPGVLRRIVSRSDRVVVSDLTLVECDRTIIRAAVERPAARSPSNRSERSLPFISRAH